MSKDHSFQQDLWALIKDIRFAMLTHRHPEGALHAHPLTMQNRDLEPGDPIYFFVSKKTELGQRLLSDGNVCVNYADPDKDVYVSISGNATISEDMALKKKLFNALAKAWFPGGAEDPDLELVAVAIQHAEYWNVKESKATQVLKMAAAAVSGKPPEMGEHRELHVHD
ncbi:pyridoxamine 5'-phosphate oxidase family protein [Ramlibacter sp.]|uniref:pyridoxamine 5'-phosphate oxidase family protein n=1 Tax=Ramlibacter sp. TaxID=1917967 RepID=UPI0018031295|nr:pyridoxamine 5'-phosphate oxidase family protein [Ramlibacter sp.]MBA2676450.1 pyridoxamine 5'-phosphate oxidase family protein [Ramlibacter sp.]